jgi:Flavin containing amine oxidoreductase
VRRIVQACDSVEIVADSVTVHARRAIVATPPFPASQISYEPALPPQHAHLLRRMSGGAVIRVLPVYGEPFWRKDGFNGESSAPGMQVWATRTSLLSLCAARIASYLGLLAYADSNSALVWRLHRHAQGQPSVRASSGGL